MPRAASVVTKVHSLMWKWDMICSADAELRKERLRTRTLPRKTPYFSRLICPCQFALGVDSLVLLKYQKWTVHSC